MKKVLICKFANNLFYPQKPENNTTMQIVLEADFFRLTDNLEDPEDEDLLVDFNSFSGKYVTAFCQKENNCENFNIFIGYFTHAKKAEKIANHIKMFMEKSGHNLSVQTENLDDSEKVKDFVIKRML